MNKYAQQDRGAAAAYEEYFAGMDASMQQKIALTTAHFPIAGRIADMGSGSGSGTFDLARLYPALELVGVDINPVTVEYSRNHYRAENLRFVTGDIAERVFPDGALDGILDSSVLHHVTSFNGFATAEIEKTLRHQVAQLRTGGVLIIRDFVVPDDTEKLVFLDLPNDDGAASGEVPELSTAALFEVFARDFRSSRNPDAPVFYRRHASPRPHCARFEATLKTAAEFVLRKDYRDHWTPELLEEYCYYSQADFEENFRRENLRIVVSMPLWNPWIVENRFAGKFFLTDLRENPLTFPPTNYLIVGEKVATGEGVRLSERPAKTHESAPREGSFLKLSFYRHKETGQIFELARRPNRTLDLLPWFETAGGQLFVLAKKDFPRPLVNAQSARENLNRASFSGYLTEPISALADSPAPPADVRQPIFEILRERAELAEREILEIGAPQSYYTSPGGIDERVESFLVKIENREKAPPAIENYTKFKSAGFVRQLDALQVLRASHVGGMFDARLEINIYRLLKKLGRSAGAWIGASLTPETQRFSGRIETAFEIERRAVFEETDAAENVFLRLCRSEFVETDAANNEIARAAFEYVVPQHYSKNTVAAIPFVKTADSVLVGVERRDLPAPQNFTGNSRLACVPAWRLPLEIAHKFELQGFLENGFARDFGVRTRGLRELGGSYFTSAGVTPEIVYPLAAEIAAEVSDQTGLRFYHLTDLLENSDKIHDAHLLILLHRLGHGLGFLSK